MKRAVGRRDAFDRGDAFAGNGNDRNSAGAHDLAIDVHATGAARADATAKLGAGELELLADDPKERRIRIRLDRDGFAVDLNLNGQELSPTVIEFFSGAGKIMHHSRPILARRGAGPN